MLDGTAPSMTFGEKKRYGMDSVLMYRTSDNRVQFLGEYPAPNLTKVQWQ